MKTDDNLTKEQAALYQWQLLVKVGDYTVYVGKGGITTMFYSQTSVDRAVCYPEEMLKILQKLSTSKVFVYEARDKKKKPLGYTVDLDIARNIENAKYIYAINFKGKAKRIERKSTDLFDKSVWQESSK